MKAFVFENVAKVSGNYHEDGGLFIVSESMETAKELISKTEDVEVTDEEWGNVLTYELSEFNGRYQERIISFPDAGCC